MSRHLHLRSAGRRRIALLTTILLAAPAALTAVPAGYAATDGPAPSPRSYTVIADVHTDTVSTFWDDGQLVLDSKADTPAKATRYAHDETWFHVDNDSRIENFPAGYEWVAPAGSTVWLAPEVQQANQIWPGFSTESVPSGSLDNDDTTLTLADVEGPGDVELWQTGAFGNAIRIWSSDEAAYKSFTRKRVHMHSNWAFTGPGIYDITVRADAAVDGTPVSDTAVYTFVVGDLPEDVETTTSLEASDTSLGAGDQVTLEAEVAPATVDGYVEFRDGATVLGHDRVEAGAASLKTVLPEGKHIVTAVLVPEVENLANTSTSAPVEITAAAAARISARLNGSNRKGGKDRLKVAAPATARDASIRLYRLANGNRKVVRHAAANHRGDAVFVVRDWNRRKTSRYVAKVGATGATLSDWTNQKRIR